MFLIQLMKDQREKEIKETKVTSATTNVQAFPKYAGFLHFFDCHFPSKGFDEDLRDICEKSMFSASAT